jgi:hypothetical protein
MLKKIIISSIFMMSLSSHALTTEEAYKAQKLTLQKKELVDSLLRPEDRINVLKTFAIIYAGIDNTENYSYYQKYLLKMNTILALKSSFYSDNTKILNEITKELFHIQVCTSYIFKQNSKDAINDILTLSLYDEERINEYNKASKYFYSEKNMSVFKMFFSKNKKNLKGICH